MKLLKSIENLSEAERLTFLGEKFTELTTENKRYATLLDQREKEKNHIERERDHLKSDCNKNILAKNKLENICRELQRQNKQIRVLFINQCSTILIFVLILLFCFLGGKCR